MATLIIPPPGASFLAKMHLTAYDLHHFTPFFTKYIVANHILEHDIIEIRRKSCNNRQKLENLAKLGGG